uniref:Pentatricopeptide repeat-containing protein At3g21470 n=1 Tax=Nelumbo nucifera TaxID=4432 RepID=A0A822ZQ56_NELNU|nr:TPA_asm: hypothetical protein HUJ06_003296 [Nelumbo nucifera]
MAPTHGSWSHLIKKHLSQGAPEEALLLYIQIRCKGIHHYGVIPLLLKACGSLSMLHHGKALHAESIKIGVDSDVRIGTSLVSMYSKCRDIVCSRRVFDEMPDRNVVTWNAMIGGYSRNGDMGSASFIFERMPEKTEVTWAEMIDGFARNGDIVAARRLFDCSPHEMRNVVTWTVMIDGYVRIGQLETARQLFEEMPQRNCYSWSSIIAGYCKKGNVKEAREIFDRIPVKNLVNWNSLIAGYAQNGYCEEALEALAKMQAEGFKPDEVTVASALSACAQMGSLDYGKEIQNLINCSNIKPNQFVFNALVDMYAKCGDLHNARMIFERMPQRNVVCWNAMISGLAIHGRSEEALDLFGRMEESSQKPNEVTFLSVLFACAHGGFVKKGLEIFSKMKEEYGLVPGIEHYGCLVDLLGRAGRLNEAYGLIKSMPMKPNDVIWGALLGACRIHLDAEMVECVEKDIEISEFVKDTGDDARYVLLSNIYAASERWEKAEKIRMAMVEKGVRKMPGYSSIMLGSSSSKDAWMY